MVEADALARPESAHPAGVQQPAVDAVAGDLAQQQVGVNARRQDHGRGAEAGAEDGLRLRAFAGLAGAEPGRVAGDELVDRLLGGEPGEGRHGARGVAGEHHDVLGVTGRLFGHRLVDERQGAGAPRVVGAGHVAEIGDPAQRIERDVLQDAAEPAGDGMDPRRGGGGETGHPGIATVLQIEDPLVAPAVRVIAEQAAARVGGQRGLAGARQAEEQRRIPLGTDVGRAVQAQDTVHGQRVVQVGEHRPLDLAGIGRVADKSQPLAEAQRDEGLRRGAVDLRRALERGDAQNGEVGSEVTLFVDRFGRGEKVAGEQAVPGQLGDHADGQTMIGIGARVDVLDEHVPVHQVGVKPVQEAAEFRRAERPVVLAPADVVFGGRFAGDERVVGRSVRVPAGVHQHRPVGGQPALAAEHDLFAQRRDRQIPVHPVELGEPLVLQGEGAGPLLGDALRRRFDLKEVLHDQSLTIFRSPMYSSVGALGSSAHLIRSTPSVTSLTEPQ